MHKQLIVDLQGYWHAGSGRTSGSHVDRLVEKDNAGLPFLSGKHLKGLLRNAVMRAESWQWFDDAHIGENIEQLLFGSKSLPNDDTSRFKTTPGILMISDARLPVAERAYLSSQQAPAPAMREVLYRSLFSTAINHESGTAESQSLRGMEVSVPVTLTSEISLSCEHPNAQQLFACLEQCLPLIDHVGAMRNRGLGRARLSFNSAGEIAV